MNQQRDMYAGYNLALVVQVSREFLPNDDNRAEAAICEEVMRHLQRRFNKQAISHLQASVDEKAMQLFQTCPNTAAMWKLPISVEAHIARRIKIAFDERISISWIDPHNPASWTEGINSRRPDAIGELFILLIRGDAAPDKTTGQSPPVSPVQSETHSAERLRERLDLELRRADAEIRVEFFHVDAAVKTSDEKDIHDALYHLASRVCSAFVEYVPGFIGPTTTPSPVKGKDPIHCVDVMAAEADLAGGVATERDLIHCSKSYIKKILDVRDAVNLICEGLDGNMHWFPPVPKEMRKVFEGRANEDSSVWVRYKFPFGVWFRGQTRLCYDLTPSLFREQARPRLHEGCDKLQPPAVMYDESSMLYHFMLHQREFRHEYQDVFAWLCLMQHYNAPSRVLDWTENILMALYFAVWETEVDCDGAVWVLNAGRLNEITRATVSRRYACFPNSTDVVLRSAMAVSHTGPELRTTLIKQKHMKQVRSTIKDEHFHHWLEGQDEAAQSAVWEKLGYPVAVYPNRANERLAKQQAAFTLHGGKSYDREIRSIPEKQKFPPPTSLVELSRKRSGKQFLDVYVVPSCAKRKLREQLKRLGIHIAAAFPELEYEAQYIRHQWRFAADHPLERQG